MRKVLPNIESEFKKKFRNSDVHEMHNRNLEYPLNISVQKDPLLKKRPVAPGL